MKQIECGCDLNQYILNIILIIYINYHIQILYIIYFLIYMIFISNQCFSIPYRKLGRVEIQSHELVLIVHTF